MNTDPAPACPPWCDSPRDHHWIRFGYDTSSEAIHTRRFGPLVTVHVGHEAFDDGLDSWGTPSIAVAPHRVELEDGPSMLAPAEAVALSAELAAAYAFATSLPATP